MLSLRLLWVPCPWVAALSTLGFELFITHYHFSLWLMTQLFLSFWLKQSNGSQFHAALVFAISVVVWLCKVRPQCSSSVLFFCYFSCGAIFFLFLLVYVKLDTFSRRQKARMCHSDYGKEISQFKNVFSECVMRGRGKICLCHSGE